MMAAAESSRDRRGGDTAVLFDETADQRLSEIFATCFTLILQLRATDAYGEAEVLRSRVKDLLENAERDALRTGVSPDNIQMAKFAIVAFIDETIISSNWSQKDRWVSKPLQLELYNQYDAGETFFSRLETLRQQPKANAEALEVYYLCLTLGFKGKYQLHEQERLREIIETTYEELQRVPGMRPKELSPHGAPRGQVATEVKSKMPAWVIAAAAALIGLLIYMSMWWYISGTAHDAADAIQNQTPSAVSR
jgi:type VI secretion system protein ImpK